MSTPVEEARNDLAVVAHKMATLYAKQRDALERITNMTEQEHGLQSARAVAKEALGE